MGSPKKVWILITKEFSEFFSSKSWIVVLILPIFITFLYTVIYRQAETKTYTVACQSTVSISIRKIFNVPQLQFKTYPNLHLAKRDLAASKIDGVILNSSVASGSIRLLVDKTRSQEAAFIANTVNAALVRAFAAKNMPLLKLEYLNPALPTRWLSLPIWLIQIILTICLLQAASSIADEKERQTVHSLLVSPMTFNDYMFSKLVWNALVGTGSILITLLLIQAQINYWAVILYGLLGCMVYAAVSILIGLFTPSSLFARAVATLVYIISALPMMIKDFTFAGKAILNLFPSYLIMSGFDCALLPNPFNFLFIQYTGSLLLETALLLGIIYLALKYKADF